MRQLQLFPNAVSHVLVISCFQLLIEDKDFHTTDWF